MAGGALETRDLVLTAPDGNRLRAFEARAPHPTGGGVVIFPDWRGLGQFYEELAMRFAEAGYDAVAFDYFGRSAGTDPHPADFDQTPHLAKTTPEGIAAARGVGRSRFEGPQTVAVGRGQDEVAGFEGATRLGGRAQIGGEFRGMGVGIVAHAGRMPRPCEQGVRRSGTRRLTRQPASACGHRHDVVIGWGCGPHFWLPRAAAPYVADPPPVSSGGSASLSRTASASISTLQRGSSKPATKTIVLAERISPKTSPWTRPIASQSSRSMRYVRVRTTSVGRAPRARSARRE